MSCGDRSRDYWHFWIVLTLLGVSVCVPIAVPIASLPVFSQSYAIASDPADLPSPAIAVDSDSAIDPVSRKMMTCNGAHPVSCIYANRAWVSHLEQELGTAHSSPESPQNLEDDKLAADNLETVNFSDRPITTVELGRKIRWLTQLKIWLDAVS